MARLRVLAPLTVALATALNAWPGGEDEAVAIVKSWRGDGYYMDIGRAADSLLLGFEAQGRAVQRLGWYATEKLPGHYDVRFTFLLDAASAEMIFLLNKDEGRVSAANDFARAAVTLATTVEVAEPTKAAPTMKAGAERTADDIQAEVEIKKRDLERIYENYLNRFPAANGKLTVRFTILASGDVAGVEVVASTVNYDALAVSLVRAIQRWHFTPAANEVTLTYPFVFYHKQ